MIDLKKYLSDSFLEYEESQLLMKSWIFIGLKDEVPQKSDYKFVQLWKRSYILFNDGNNFRFFQNLCPHRGAELISSSGSGNIKCKYHGWIFNSAGKAFPAGKRLFSCMDEAPGLYAMTCQAVGNFIFATKNCPKTIEDFLGTDITEYLNLVSDSMALRIDRNELSIASNWKIVVENTLESYHIGEVHPGSLAPYFEGVGESRFFGLHSCVIEKFTESFRSSVIKLKGLFFGKSDFNDYKHVFIFPNLTVATSGFSNFFIQEFLPLTASHSKFVSHGFLPKFRDGIPEASKKGFIEAAVTFNRRVFSEDQVICETVQRGLNNMLSPEFKPVISDKEDRWSAFVEIYNNLMVD